MAILGTLVAAGASGFMLAFPLWMAWTSVHPESIRTLSRWIWGASAAASMRFPTIVMVSVGLALPVAALIVRRQRVTAAGRQRIERRTCLGCDHTLGHRSGTRAEWVDCSECGLLGPRRAGRSMEAWLDAAAADHATPRRRDARRPTVQGRGEDRSTRLDPATAASAEVGLELAGTVRRIDGSSLRSVPPTEPAPAPTDAGGGSSDEAPA